MDIVVKGRHTEVSDRFRRLAADKLARLHRLDPKVIRVDVEVSREQNPRLSSVCERVELTCASRGPVIRAEAAAVDACAALDLALAKLETRLRRAADRRRVHHGSRTPMSLAAATALPPGPTPGGTGPGMLTASVVAAAGAAPVEQQRAWADGPAGDDEAGRATRPATAATGPTAGEATGERAGATAGGPTGETTDARAGDSAGDRPDTGAAGPILAADGPFVVREKVHDAEPMTLDQALFALELVGHDFYLFVDADSGLPSVVYRRRAYNYGVIRLRTAGVGANVAW